MKDTNIQALINQTLQADERLWNDDKTELNQILLLALVEKLDETIIDLLFHEETLKEKFFVSIKDVYVFNINVFRFFMEENKIDNSYTQYKNRIGLTDGKRFLKDTKDVVLDFPYKDCVLEGGQSTEEGDDTYFEYDETVSKTDEKKGYSPKQYNQKTAKRKEIFFNTVLAHDETDRLLAPKALVQWKRYSKDGAQKATKIKRDKDGTIKENMIIKGNNLLALHSLKKQFAGKVKLIYIDPPYNTGGSNNIFSYNNNFNHSTWLTFMKNRLEVARKLLRDDGVLQVTIDENELNYLGILIDEIFEGYEKHCITIVHNPRGVIGQNFSYTNEFVYFVFKKGLKVINKVKRDNILERGFRNNGGESLRTDAKNCFYPILVKNSKLIGFGKVSDNDFHPGSKNIKRNDGIIEIYPIDSKGIERKWEFARQSVEQIKDKLVVKERNNEIDIFRIKDEKLPRTVWIGSRYDANEHGSKIVNKVIEGKTVSFPKSLYAVYDCIDIVVKNDKDAIVLDFCAGSGTTGHAVLEVNQEDGGNRKFILVEQLGEHVDVCNERMQQVMQKDNLDISFLYCELAKHNETAREHILACKSLQELTTFFNEMRKKYFLNYNLKIKEFQDKVIPEKEFQALPLDEQKRIFIAMLDNNQMYVNKTEMADTKYGIVEEDKKMTRKFYGG